MSAAEITIAADSARDQLLHPGALFPGESIRKRRSMVDSEAVAQQSIANKILDALPAEIYRAMRAELELVTLGREQTLYEVNAPVETVYFPLEGVIALQSMTVAGSTVTVATVGNEGMIGLPVFLGMENMRIRAVSCIAGRALALNAAIFCALTATPGPLQTLLHRYKQALFNEAAQYAACNRHHAADARYASRVLLTCDRMSSNSFPITQEFISQMLGAGRSTTHQAAGLLKRDGLIAYSRSKMAVIDRAGLENASCECYRIIKDGYAHVLC